MKDILNLPNRVEKPRSTGLNILIDNGYPTNFFEDVIRSHHSLIDRVKFGWGTSVVTGEIRKKIEVLKNLDIPFFFGGTLFEKFYSQDKVDKFFNLCKDLGCESVEVSDGTIEIKPEDRGRIINEVKDDFVVLSEVGFKDQERSQLLSPTKWIALIEKDIESGAKFVILEARESGSSGICRPNGEVRYGLIEEVIDSGLPVEKLIFEAPNKKLQTYFIKKVGPNVNLANIAFNDVVAMETLRLGLRSETLLLF